MKTIRSDKLEKLSKRLKELDLDYYVEISFGEKTELLSDFEDSGGYYRQTWWKYYLTIGDDFNWDSSFVGSLVVENMTFGITRHVVKSRKGRRLGQKSIYLTKGLIQCYSYRDALIKSFKDHKYLLPKNWKFQKDAHGYKFVRGDGMEYHPMYHEWGKPDLFEHVNKKMAENKKLRASQKKAEKHSKFLEKLFQKDLATTMVTLYDSRKAGNCIEGSLQFAERRLNIPREEIVKGGFLFKIPAYKLVKTGEQRALTAAKVAWNRETMVCI